VPPKEIRRISMEEHKGAKIIVRWDTLKCVHAGMCVRTLPAVFDVKKNPWVNPDGASIEEIKKAVSKCPSGALSCEER
jgi:uncharacterized Fe-S cluster protein YjdI